MFQETQRNKRNDLTNISDVHGKDGDSNNDGIFFNFTLNFIVYFVHKSNLVT